VAEIGLGVLERYEAAIRVVVLPEILTAKNLTVCTRVAELVHLIDKRHEAGLLRVEGVDHIVGLLEEHLLELVDAVLENFHLHGFVSNIYSVGLHECDAEPLGAKSLLFDEDTRGQLVQLSAYISLLLLGDFEGFELVVFLPALEVGVRIQALLGLVAPALVMEPEELFVVKHDNIVVLHLKALTTEPHSLSFLAIPVSVALLSLHVEASKLADNIRQTDQR
jgi:hypothetical protein